MDNRILILFAILVLAASYLVLTSNIYSNNPYAKYTTDVNACYEINKTGYPKINVYVSDAISGTAGLSYDGKFVMMNDDEPFIIIKTYMMNASKIEFEKMMKHEYCLYLMWSNKLIERGEGMISAASEGDCFYGGTVNVTKENLAKISCSTTPFARYYSA